jgi:hypothetical protein
MGTINLRPDLPGPPLKAERDDYMRLGARVADRVETILRMLPEASRHRLVPRIVRAFLDAGLTMPASTLLYEASPPELKWRILLADLRPAPYVRGGPDWNAQSEMLMRALAAVEQLVAAEVMHLCGPMPGAK